MRGFRPLHLPGLALAAILLIGLASNVAALVSGDGPRAGGDFSREAIVEGEPTAALGRFLLHHNPLADALVAADRVIAWNLVGDLGTRVRQGCPGWLFLADELEIHPDGAAAMSRRLAIVKQVAEFLARRRIALVVALVPDKSRIEAGELCGLDRPAVLAPRYEAALSRLRAAGVAAVDLLPPLETGGGERYYRTDTHWNERGARTAAEAIAAGLRRTGLAPAPGQAEFRVTKGKPHERVGDLIRLAGLDEVPLPFRPAGDEVADSDIATSSRSPVPALADCAMSLSATSSPAGRNGTGLLDEVAAPQVAVIGTSFSRRANFTNFLALALTAPVIDKAEDGGSQTRAAIAYFADPAFTAAPPHVIVWEIPERILQTPVAASETAWAAGLAGGK
jgi:alginate O-acetyltransferase complex protein AlgJ